MTIAILNDGETGGVIRGKINDNFGQLWFLPVGQRSPGAQYYLQGNNEQGTITQVVSSTAVPVRRNRTTTAASTNARGEFAELARFQSNAAVVSRYRLVFVLPDSDYGSGSTGARVGAGLVNGSFGDYLTDQANAHSSYRGVFFRYDTNASDTTWQFVVRLTGTPADAVVTNTAITVTPGQLYEAVFVLDGGASPTVSASIRAYPGGTAWSVSAQSYPAEVAVAQAFAIRTLSAVARAIDFTDWTLEREAG